MDLRIFYVIINVTLGSRAQRVGPKHSQPSTHPAVSAVLTYAVPLGISFCVQNRWCQTGRGPHATQNGVSSGSIDLTAGLKAKPAHVGGMPEAPSSASEEETADRAPAPSLLPPEMSAEAWDVLVKAHQRATTMDIDQLYFVPSMSCSVNAKGEAEPSNSVGCICLVATRE